MGLVGPTRCQTWRAGSYTNHRQKLFSPLSWDTPTLPQFTTRAQGSRGALLLEGREGEQAAGW